MRRVPFVLFALALPACTPSSENGNSDTSPGSDTGDDWRTGAYADVDLAFSPLSGSDVSWSFRLEDGDPNSGSRYADEVSVGTYNPDDEDVDVLRVSHNGCPDGSEGESPSDRPLRFWVWSGSSGGTRLLVEFAPETCDPDEDDVTCYEADESWSWQDFTFGTEGDLREGSASGELYCVDNGGDGDEVGRISLSVLFVARYTE